MSVTLHTSAGDLKLELFCEKAPKTCENFLALCASDYYKNNVFHRNIKDFMVQTGDPTGQGKGGQSIYGAPFEDEFSTELTHDKRGILSMANNGPNTNKSQFFITYAPAKHLDLKYTIFGHVIDGFDALEELESIKVDAKYRPVVEQRIKDVTIHANPIALNQDPSQSSDHSNVLDRVQKMNEYYSQYIEEYYEEEEGGDGEYEKVTREEKKKEKPVASTVQELVELLKDARAMDIAVFGTQGRDGEAPSGPFTILCSPLNPRHSRAIAAALSETTKVSDGEGTRRSAKRAAGWLVVQVTEADTIVHVMEEEVRQRFDLESMLSGAEEGGTETEEGGVPDIPPPRL